jgi:hypothetical protein
LAKGCPNLMHMAENLSTICGDKSADQTKKTL